MKKNSELTYKEMYRQPASFQAVNDTLEDIFKTLDKVFFSEKKYDELIFTGCGTSLYLAQASAAAFSTYTGIPSKGVPCSELYYFPETYDFVEEKGNPVLPDLTYLNNETWTYECVVTPKEGDYYSKGYEKLFDLNATAWATSNHYDFLKYEITVDMQETKRVNGFAIEQVASDIATSPRKRAFMARKVQVQFSVDGSVWTEAIDYTLGTTLGEIDLLSIAAPTNARYLKFVLTDQNYRNVYSISLQKIRIF